MTSFQSPQVLTDLYRDLRDRKLLPLVVVLVVGIAVVPIALSSEAEPVPAVPPVPSAETAGKSNAPAKEVVVANPGVRDYKRRLDDAPKDPFVQEFTAPVGLPAAGGADASSAPSGAPAAPPATPGGGTTNLPATPGASGGVTQVETETALYTFHVRVRTGQVGGELETRNSVDKFTALPSKAVPAATFLGVTTDNDLNPKAAVFLVSASVSSVSGEGSCVFAGSYCQLLYLKPGQHQDLVWVDGLAYRVAVAGFDVVAVRDNSQGNGGGSGSGDRVRRHFTF
jgi:hypothetical protein